MDLPQPELADEPDRLALGHVEIDPVDRMHDLAGSQEAGTRKREVLDEAARLEQALAARQAGSSPVIEGLGVRACRHGCRALCSGTCEGAARLGHPAARVPAGRHLGKLGKKLVSRFVSPAKGVLLSKSRAAHGTLVSRNSSPSAGRAAAKYTKPRQGRQFAVGAIAPAHRTGETSMKVGVLGSGDVAKTLARGFLKHGHEVMLGTRDAAKLGGLGRRSQGAQAGSFADAAKFGELVVLAVKGTAALDALTRRGRG